MRALRQVGYELRHADGRTICKPQVTVEALIEFASKYAGINLVYHVFSESEIHLYDKPLNDPDKTRLFTITGTPAKRGCCGG